MNKLICLLLLVANFYGASAQQLTQTLKGRIVDQVSKSPIIGATIVIQGSEPLKGSTTDIEGYFSIKEVPIGRVSLLVSSVGYDQKAIPNVLIESGKEKFLNLDMIESLIEMEEVVVVADRQNLGQPLNELATVSAISISMEETSRMAATFDDPARAALTFAGVSTGGDDLLNEIVIRGNSPKGILWRLEGVEIPNPNHFGEVGSSAGGISMLSSNLLSTSDFFTSAFPSDYGNATSGIFDLRMRQGNYDTHEHSIQAGLLGVAASSEGPINRDKRSSYLVNYRYSTLALFDNLGIEILGSQEDVTFQDLSFKVNLPGTKLGTFSIWGLGGKNTYTYRPLLEFGEWDYEDNEQQMGVAGLTNVAYLNKNTYLNTVVTYSLFDTQYIFDSLRVRDLENEHVIEKAFRVSSYLNHKFNAKNSIRIGGIFSNLAFDLASDEWNYFLDRSVNYLDEKGNTNFFQAFTNWQHRANEQLTFNVGLHASHFRLNQEWYIEPRLGFRWAYQPGKAFTGGAGLHSRMETLALYMGKEFLEDGSFRQNNRDLSFTKAAHVVLGHEWMLTDKIRFKTEAYYQHLYDVPVWATDTTSNQFLRSFSVLNSFEGWTSNDLANRGSGRNYGLEFTLEKFFSNGYYFLSTLSLYESKYKGVDGIERSTRFDGKYIFNVVGGKEWTFGANDNKVISINGRAISSGGKREAPINAIASQQEGFTIRDFSRNFDTQLDPYWRFDLGITYKVNKVNRTTSIVLNVQNVIGRANEFGRYYSTVSNQIVSESQVGMFPNLAYKISF